MGDSKVRCTTCYNVFNTSKEEGKTVICPMCDNSFAVKKVNIVSNITQSISDFTAKVGANIKEKITSEANDEDAVFEMVDGKKYDKDLLRVATKLTKEKEEITLEGSKELFTQISDYDDYTQVESKLLHTFARITNLHLKQTNGYAPKYEDGQKFELGEKLSQTLRVQNSRVETKFLLHLLISKMHTVGII